MTRHTEAAGKPARQVLLRNDSAPQHAIENGWHVVQKRRAQNGANNLAAWQRSFTKTEWRMVSLVMLPTLAMRWTQVLGSFGFWRRATSDRRCSTHDVWQCIWRPCMVWHLSLAEVISWVIGPRTLNLKCISCTEEHPSLWPSGLTSCCACNENIVSHFLRRHVSMHVLFHSTPCNCFKHLG